MQNGLFSPEFDVFSWYPCPALIISSGLISRLNEPAKAALGSDWEGKGASELIGSEAAEIVLSGKPGAVLLPDMQNGGTRFRVSAFIWEDNTLIFMQPSSSVSGEETTDLLLNIDRHLRAQLSIMLPSIRKAADVMRITGDEKGLAAISSVRQTALRLLRMSNNARDLARFMRGEEILRPCDHDFYALCRGVAEKTKTALEPLELSLDFRCEEGELWLSGDEDQLERLLYNLITNALRLSPEVLLSVAHRGDNAVVSVFNSGAGMMPETLNHLYDAYTVPHEELNDGVSFGMPLCKSIVERHGGSMLVSSGAAGNTVTVSLPVRLSDNMTIREPGADYTGEYRHDEVELSVLPIVRKKKSKLKKTPCGLPQDKE